MLSLSKFFSPILLSCTSKSADDLMDHFNSSMLDIMDNIAPFLKLKMVNKNQKAPWKLNWPYAQMHHFLNFSQLLCFLSVIIGQID